MAKIAVVGAGNGGLAACVDLKLRGHDVKLWNRGSQTLDPIQGGIYYDGVLGTGSISLGTITTDIGEAIKDASVILVCLPALAHDDVATLLAPHLRPSQIIVLNPGGLLGSLAVAKRIRAAGYGHLLNIAETATLSYICRKKGPAHVNITSVATELPFATLPGIDGDRYTDEVKEVLPQLVALPNILAAGIASINTVLHPPAMILAAAWIERTSGDFAYYADTAVPSVARLMRALDSERLAIARAWDITTDPFLEIFARLGSTSASAAASGDFQLALEESIPNRSIRAPQSLDSRYLHEDIPYGVVPLADLGRLAGISTPILDAIITITSTITGRDYRAEGRTLQRCGLANASRVKILEFANTVRV